MAVFTEESWDVDGVSLHTYAYGVEVLSEGIPPRRGSNFTVPFRHGEVWRPKQYGPRPLAMAMWVTDQDVDGNVPGTETARRAQLRQNVETLKALFAPVNRQVTLTRRIRLQSGLVTRQALAECTGTLDFVPDSDLGDAIIRFGVEMVMADPYWYDIGFTTHNLAFNVGLGGVNPGSARAQYMTIQLNGPLTGASPSPPITVANATTGVSVTYAGNILAAHYVLLDTNNYTAVDDVAANVIGAVQHVGAHSWMELAPGNNNLLLTAAAGSGNAVISYLAPYL